MAKYSADHVLPSPLHSRVGLTSRSAFFPGSSTLHPTLAFLCNIQVLRCIFYFLDVMKSSSWELGFAPADTTCWHWKHCLFLSTNCMQTIQSALLFCIPLSAKDCESGACQENRQRSYLKFIFQDRAACQKRTGGQRQPLPPPLCFNLFDFRVGFSLHFLAFSLLG